MGPCEAICLLADRDGDIPVRCKCRENHRGNHRAPMIADPKAELVWADRSVNGRKIPQKASENAGREDNHVD